MQQNKTFTLIDSISSQRFGKSVKKNHDVIAPLLKSQLSTQQNFAQESNTDFIRSYN